MIKLLYILIGLVLAIAIYFTVLGYISRQGQAPGLVDGRLASCGSKPNAVCSDNNPDTAHAIAPIAGSVGTFQKVGGVIKAMGGKLIQQEADYIAAQFSSSLFGFVDDFELRFDADQQLIHIRAASRVGYSDMGVNRKRADRFRAQLER